MGDLLNNPDLLIIGLAALACLVVVACWVIVFWPEHVADAKDVARDLFPPEEQTRPVATFQTPAAKGFHAHRSDRAAGIRLVK